MEEIPKVRENFGHRGEKMEEIPKMRKHFGHRGGKRRKQCPKEKSLHSTLDNTVDKKCLERR